jgi:hypothetical protein
VFNALTSAILDSGSSIRIFNDSSRFLEYRPAPYGDYVLAGEGKVQIYGYGTVEEETYLLDVKEIPES